MRREVIRRVAETVSCIAKSIEEVATELDDEDLPHDHRQKIDRALRAADREIDRLRRHLEAMLTT